MRASTCRRGLTLLELMIASGISLVVALALATLVVGVRRLMVRSFGVARTSLALRAERDRLQFHSLEEGGNARWAGLLSASKIESVSLDPAEIRYTASGVDAASVGAMSRGSQVYRLNPYRIDDVGTECLDGCSLFAVTLTHEYPDKNLTAFPEGIRVRASDRVVVPAFGVEQVSFGLDSPGEILERVWGGE